MIQMSHIAKANARAGKSSSVGTFQTFPVQTLSHVGNGTAGNPSHYFLDIGIGDLGYARR